MVTLSLHFRMDFEPEDYLWSVFTFTRLDHELPIFLNELGMIVEMRYTTLEGVTSTYFIKDWEGIDLKHFKVHYYKFEDDIWKTTVREHKHQFLYESVVTPTIRIGVLNKKVSEIRKLLTKDEGAVGGGSAATEEL